LLPLLALHLLLRRLSLRLFQRRRRERDTKMRHQREKGARPPAWQHPPLLLQGKTERTLHLHWGEKERRKTEIRQVKVLAI
jgi:hypothetical protein